MRKVLAGLLLRPKFNDLLKILIFLSFISLIPRFEFNLRKDLTADESLSAIFSLGLHQKFDTVGEKIFGLKKSLKQQYPHNPVIRFHQLSQALIDTGETHPPLYYFSLSYWVDIFGISKESLRLHSLLGLICFLGLLSFTCYKLEGTTYALLSVFLALMSSHLELQLLNARMHIWTLCLGVLIIAISLEQQKSNKMTIVILLSYILGVLHSFLLWPVVLISSFFVSFTRKSRWPLLFAAGFLSVYYLSYAGQQLEALPVNEFLYAKPGPWKHIHKIFTNQDHGLLALMPFHSWLKTFTITAPLYIIGVLFIFYKIINQAHRKRYILFLLIIACPYIIDLLVGGHSSTWARARSINFIHIPILLISADFFILVLRKNKAVAATLIFIAFVMTTKLSFYFFEMQREIHEGKLSDMTRSIQAGEKLEVVTNSLHKSSILKILLSLREQKGQLTVLHTKVSSRSWSSLILSKLNKSPAKQLLTIESQASVDYDLNISPLSQQDIGIIRMPTGPYDHYNWSLYKRM